MQISLLICLVPDNRHSSFLQVPVVVDETRIEVVDTKEEEIKEEEDDEEEEEEEDEGLMSASQMLQQAGMQGMHLMFF